LIYSFQVYLSIVRWWFLCALVADCIAPTSELYCKFGTGADRDSQYARCHRYDQSALNVLLVNHFTRQLMSAADNNQVVSDSFQLTEMYSSSAPLTTLRRERHNELLGVCTTVGQPPRMSRHTVKVDEYFPRGIAMRIFGY
jgi:hypothetical protein